MVLIQRKRRECCRILGRWMAVGRDFSEERSKISFGNRVMPGKEAREGQRREEGDERKEGT